MYLLSHATLINFYHAKYTIPIVFTLRRKFFGIRSLLFTRSFIFNNLHFLHAKLDGNLTYWMFKTP